MRLLESSKRIKYCNQIYHICNLFVFMDTFVGFLSFITCVNIALFLFPHGLDNEWISNHKFSVPNPWKSDADNKKKKTHFQKREMRISDIFGVFILFILPFALCVSLLLHFIWQNHSSLFLFDSWCGSPFKRQSTNISDAGFCAFLFKLLIRFRLKLWQCFI